MLIEKAMKQFGISYSDVKDVIQSKNLLVTELKLNSGFTLQVNTLSNKSKLITK